MMKIILQNWIWILNFRTKRLPQKDILTDRILGAKGFEDKVSTSYTLTSLDSQSTPQEW